MPASIGPPGADSGAVGLWISGGGVANYLSKRPSHIPSSQTTVKLLEQFKVSQGTVAEEKNKYLYEKTRIVTWA